MFGGMKYSLTFGKKSTCLIFEFFSFVRRVIVLEDNDVLNLTGGGYGIYNTEGSDVEEAVPRVLLTLQMEVEQIMKV